MTTFALRLPRRRRNVFSGTFRDPGIVDYIVLQCINNFVHSTRRTNRTNRSFSAIIAIPLIVAALRSLSVSQCIVRERDRDRDRDESTIRKWISWIFSGSRKKRGCSFLPARNNFQRIRIFFFTFSSTEKTWISRWISLWPKRLADIRDLHRSTRSYERDRRDWDERLSPWSSIDFLHCERDRSIQDPSSITRRAIAAVFQSL